jgi:DNA-binding HxlR family transcriptional regulator
MNAQYIPIWEYVKFLFFPPGAVWQSHLQDASENCYAKLMQKKKAPPRRRSGCPLNASVEMLGDRWSLLILRDMMLRGYQTFKEFLHLDEKIATNILADRLRRLECHGIIETARDPADGRRQIYTLTAKGIDLAPVLTEMVLWAARHEETGDQALLRQMRTDKQQLLASVRERWAGKHSPLSS